jgi:hypothetical protein
MLSYIDKLFLGQHHRQAPLASLLLVLSMFAGVTNPAFTNELPSRNTYKISVRTEGLSKNTYDAKGKVPQKDGIYLYGQSPKPQQIGQEYIVIEVNKGKAIGAFYLPHSEFNCFNGTIQQGKLALLLASNSESEAYPDAPGGGANPQQVAVIGNRPLGENGSNDVSTPYSVALQNYHQLSKVSNSDRQILAACKSNYAGGGAD